MCWKRTLGGAVRSTPCTHALPARARRCSLAGLTDDAGRVVWSRTYDDNGNVETYTDRFGTTTFEYGPEGAGRPTHITDPQGQVTTLAYDEGGNVTRATRGALTMTFRYDAAGRRLFADYGRGVTVSYEYSGPTDDWTAIEGPSFGRVERRFSSGGRLLS